MIELTESEKRRIEEGEQLETARGWWLADLLKRPELVEAPEPLLRCLAWPGRLVVLAAPDKAGKSTLLGAASSALTAGQPWLECETTPGVVVWLGEEHPGDVARRLAGSGADPDRVRVVRLRTDPAGDLEAEIREYGASLAIVDTLAGYAESAAPESGSASAWARVMRPLARLAQETDCAIVVLHHVRKSDGTVRDSGEIAAAADVLIEMQGPFTGTTRRLIWRGRYGRGSIALKLEDGAYHVTEERTEASVDAAITNFIAAHPGCTRQAVIDGLGRRAEDIRQSIARLVDAGTVEDRGTGKARAPRAFYVVPASGRRSTSDTYVVPSSALAGLTSDDVGGRPPSVVVPVPPKGGTTTRDVLREQHGCPACERQGAPCHEHYQGIAR